MLMLKEKCKLTYRLYTNFYFDYWNTSLIVIHKKMCLFSVFVRLNNCLYGTAIQFLYIKGIKMQLTNKLQESVLSKIKMQQSFNKISKLAKHISQ